MVTGRKRRKASHKNQRTLCNASFELTVTEAKLCGMNSDKEPFESPYPTVCDFQGDFLALPQLEGWNHNDAILSVHQLPAIVSAVNLVMET